VKLSDFDYELPSERIAQTPAAVRDEARLLVHVRATGETHHRRVRELGEFLAPGDLLVLNDTRVLRARLFARRASGGRIELFLLEPRPGDALVWKAFVHPAQRLKLGETLALEGAPIRARLLERALDPAGHPGMEWCVSFAAAAGEPLEPERGMEAAGHVPLPPYVERADAAGDAERYQTVFARVPGAVAAPTAGLHFTPELLASLAAQGIARAPVTLHVGAGTFQPVKSEDVTQHRMHAERYVLPEETVAAVRAAGESGGRVVAVGTTSVRVLESSVDAAGELVAGAGSTRLYLLPGARFRAVDALLTNFHLPRSTLLMLVCAFAGRERVLELYREAVERGYRFYSYGDAMLIL